MAIRKKEALLEDSCIPHRPVEAGLRSVVFLSAWLVASWTVTFQLQWESL
jgi:hypothetical protein